MKSLLTVSLSVVLCGLAGTAPALIQERRDVSRDAVAPAKRLAADRAGARAADLPPPNDECRAAELLSVPGWDQEWTTDATLDNAPFCDVYDTAPGVWYKVIGTGGGITATTCV